MSAFETIEAQLSLSAEGFTSTIDDATAKLGDLESSSGNVDKAIGTLGASMAAAGAGGIAASISAFADFEGSMVESQAIMGDLTNNEMAAMEDAARDVGRTSTFSADEAADAFFYLSSAGLDASESIDQMGTMSEFAQAGAFDMAQATDILTDSASALGMEVDEYNDLADVLVKSNTLANATVEEFGQAMQVGGGRMADFNMSAEEGVSVLSVWADQGLKGQKAGTAMNQTLRDLGRGARENSDAWEELGVSVYDAEGEFRGMEPIVRDLEDATEGMSSEQRDAALATLGLTDEGQRNIGMLLGQSDALAEYEGELHDAGGTAEEVAQNQLQSLSAQWDILTSQIADIAIEIGGALAPAFERIIASVSGAVERFASFNRATDGVAGAVTFITMLISGVTMTLATLASQLGFASSAMSALVSPIRLVGTALLSLNPITAALTAAVVAFAAAYRSNFLGVRDLTNNVVGTVLHLLGRVVSFIRQEVAITVQDFRAMWERVGPDVLATVNRMASGVITVLTALGTAVMSVVGPMLDRLRGLWETHTDGVYEQYSGAMWGLVQFTEEAIRWILDVINGGLDFIDDVWRAHGETVLSIVNTAWDAITTAITTGLTAIQNIWNSTWPTLRAVLTTFLNFVVNTIGTYIQNSYNRLKAGLDLMRQAWNTVWPPLRAVLTTFLDFVVGTIGTYIQNSYNRLKAGLDLMRQAWNTVWPPLRAVLTTFFNFVVDTIGTYIQNSYDRLVSGLELIQQAWTTYLRPLVQRTIEIFGQIYDTITQVLDQVWAFLAPYLAEIEQAWQEHGTVIIEDVRRTWNSLIETITPAIEFIRDLIDTTLDFITGLWQTHGDETMSILSAAWDLYVDVVRSNIELIWEWVQWGLENIRRFWSVWGEDIMATMRMIFETIVTIIKGLLDFLATTIRVGLAVIRGDWSEAWTLVAEYLSRTFDRIIGLTQGWIDVFVGWIQTAVERVIGWFQTLYERLVGNSIIPDMFNAILAVAAGFGDRLIAWLTGVIQQFLARAQQWMAQTVQRVQSGLQMVLQTAATFGQNLLGWITQTIQNFLARVQAWMAQTVQRVQAGLSTVLQTAATFGSNLLAWIANTVNNFLSTINAWLQTLITAISQTFGNILSFAMEWGGRFLDWIFGVASNAWDTFREFLTLLADGVWETFNNIYDFIVDWGSDFYDSIDGTISDVLDRFSDLYDDGVQSVRDLISDINSAIRDWSPGDIFENALDGVRGRFSDLKRDVVGNSIVPDMLNQTLAETSSWQGDFEGQYASTAGEVGSSFSDMHNMADAPTPGVDRSPPSDMTEDELRLDPRFVDDGDGGFRLGTESTARELGMSNPESATEEDLDMAMGTQSNASMGDFDTDFDFGSEMQSSIGGGAQLSDISGELETQTGMMGGGVDRSPPSDMTEDELRLDPRFVDDGDGGFRLGAESTARELGMSNPESVTEEDLGPHLDTGGFIRKSGSAVVHKGEQVMTADTVDALRDLLSGSGASGGGGETGLTIDMGDLDEDDYVNAAALVGLVKESIKNEQKRTHRRGSGN